MLRVLKMLILSTVVGTVFMSTSVFAQKLTQRVIVPIERSYISDEVSIYAEDGFGYNKSGEIIFCLDSELLRNSVCKKGNVYTVQSYLERHRKLNNITNKLEAYSYGFVFGGSYSTTIYGLVINYGIVPVEGE